MKTTYAGRSAEAAVAEFLKGQKYEILDRNWRTRLCEIDLIAKKASVIYFVEVKFRGSDTQGDGLEYVTARKLKQMRFAAEVWLAENNWQGDWRLMAASVSGDDYKAIELVEI